MCVYIKLTTTEIIKTEEFFIDCSISFAYFLGSLKAILFFERQQSLVFKR